MQNVVAFPPIAFWSSEVIRGKDERIVENIPNAEIILRKDPRWKGVFGYNEFERKVFVQRKLPWDSIGEAIEPRPLNNLDLIHVQSWLQKQGGMFTMSSDTAYGAVQMVSQKFKYHPIKDWLATLPAWDGVERVGSWLTDVFGVEESPYTKMVGKMFLLGMLRRALYPGVKMDYMLILEGSQGIGKSTACEVLCNNFGYGVAQFKSLDSVDTSIFIRNKWLVEFGEMHALRKAEVNELKLWLVKTVEDYRPKYGRTNENEPRQCTFIGTSNSSEYLNDTTGGRRFWPVKCMRADIEMLRDNLEQIWAEVKISDLAGDRHYPEKEEEEEHFAPEQASRMVVDVWEDVIFPWASKMDKVTLAGLCNRVGFTREKIDTFSMNRVKAIMAKFKWEKKKGMHGVYYQRPPPVEEKKD